MQLSIGTVCSNPAGESPVDTGTAWTQDACAACPTLRMRLRGLAWSIALSVILWIGFFVVGHVLRNLWR